jgi:hypothetical protein
VRSAETPITEIFMLLLVKNLELALSLLRISNISDKKWLMRLLHKNQEKLRESQKVLIPMHPERKTNHSVTIYIILVPPKNAKEAEEKKKNAKAN